MTDNLTDDLNADNLNKALDLIKASSNDPLFTSPKKLIFMWKGLSVEYDIEEELFKRND